MPARARPRPQRARGADVTASRGHIPVRRCIACGRRAAKHELVRFVAAPDGGVLRLVRDDRMRMAGRGAYVCPDAACFERAIARRGFQRAARTGGLELVIDPGLMASPAA